ncbi:low molecular weight protein-tyrosine-phosphatase [Lysinibacillus sp. KU-BSD001]|uniref:low molecular weight protein-tyrosine-phosphatase n=1 Tax=Lysinibacillus sp. KU-BSD001 TaxID=3141328 RepID=UPI0036EE4BEB
MIRVLFVCLGNICRSPMAEAVMRDLVEKRGLAAQIKVDSAGTSNWHAGEPPHKGTREKLKEMRISTSGMVSRQLRTSDLEFEYIVCMDASNVENTRDMLRAYEDAKIFRFLDLTSHKKDVPDPWYTGNFQETYELCVEGCEVLLERILEEHQLG